MEQPILTLDMLNKFDPHTVMFTGTAINAPGGIYMESAPRYHNKELLWAAVRGGINDWCIVIHWKCNGLDFVVEQGDKVVNKEYIRQLVPCTDEAFKRYRY